VLRDRHQIGHWDWPFTLHNEQERPGSAQVTSP
jgi:hypothetical protein